MSELKEYQPDSIVRRWVFYSGPRLAFGGVAYRTGSGEVQLRIVETENHASTASLPERIGLEQVVRERIRSDIEHVMGQDARISIQFEPRKQAEDLVVKDVFG